MNKANGDESRLLLAAKLHAIFAVCNVSANREVTKVYGDMLMPLVGAELWQVMDEAIAAGGRLPSALELSERVIVKRRAINKEKENTQWYLNFAKATEEASTPKAKAAARECLANMKKLLGDWT